MKSEERDLLLKREDRYIWSGCDIPSAILEEQVEGGGGIETSKINSVNVLKSKDTYERYAEKTGLQLNQKEMEMVLEIYLTAENHMMIMIRGTGSYIFPLIFTC